MIGAIYEPGANGIVADAIEFGISPNTVTDRESDT